MNHFQRKNSTAPAVQGSMRGPSLSDLRYQDLLKSASAFFTSAEESTDEVRQAVIDEINALMKQYGLTPDDLM
jgi:hypothetical protein